MIFFPQRPVSHLLMALVLKAGCHYFYLVYIPRSRLDLKTRQETGETVQTVHEVLLCNQDMILA